MPLFHRKAQPSQEVKPAAPPVKQSSHRPTSTVPPKPQQHGHGHGQSTSHGQYQPNGTHNNAGVGANGYGGQQQAPPNSNRANDAYLRPIFQRVDKDRSGTIDVHELKLALINSNYDQFDLDTVKMLLNMFDTDRSGTIAFNEFIGLFKYIEDWQGVFRHWDTDRSGSIDEQELAGALAGFGYNLSPHIVNAIMVKYSTSPVGYGTPPPSISFDRFVRACVATKELSDSFRNADRGNTGWIQVNYDQFMEMVLHAP